MMTIALPRHLLLIAGLAVLLLSGPVLRGAYTLVWSDEFSGANGSPPNPTNWTYDTGGWGWGNNEEQYYTTSTNNSRIENGNLVIELREDSANSYPGNDYTSARLKSLGLQAWTYGRIEARIRLPYGAASGLWPAFWMLGTDFPEIGWPHCGEIDIMEYISREPNEVFGTIHGPGYSGGASFGSIYNYGGPIAPPAPPNLPDPYDPAYYHIYTVEWIPNQIRWYIDGILYHTATPSSIAPNAWVFDHDHFIILNVAIGGNFGGTIDANNLVFPTQMLVDWVRVYQDDSYEPPSTDIPARVQAENFTSQSGIQTETCTDTGGGLNVGYMDDGNWMEYVLKTPTAGRYAIDMRVASDAPVRGRFILSAESESFTSPDIPDTGGWQNWITIDGGEIDLPTGVTTLRVTVETPGPGQDAMNLNWMDMSLVKADPDVDVDGDGFINLLEQAYGLDMFTRDLPSKGPRGAPVKDTGVDYMSLSYRRLTGGSGTTGVSYAAGGYSYVVQVSPDMSASSWVSGSSHVQAVGSPVNNGDGTETVTVRAKAPITGNGRFMRLVVSETAPAAALAEEATPTVSASLVESEPTPTGKKDRTFSAARRSKLSSL
jgi:beta-glucanase (GH16 family)